MHRNATIYPNFWSITLHFVINIFNKKKKRKILVADVVFYYSPNLTQHWSLLSVPRSPNVDRSQYYHFLFPSSFIIAHIHLLFVSIKLTIASNLSISSRWRIGDPTCWSDLNERVIFYYTYIYIYIYICGSECLPRKYGQILKTLPRLQSGGTDGRYAYIKRAQRIYHS